MKKYINLILFFALVLVVIGCGKNEITNKPQQPNVGKDDPIDPDQNNGWLIPQNNIVDGGPGKDGIPALTNPEFVEASAITYLADNDLVLGYFDDNEVRAYPHPILDYHEIINDDIGDESIAIIYCPLTGTGIGWDRVVAGNKTTFGVSGLLHNSNLIPYDRATDSYWSQMLLKGVKGDRSGVEPEIHNLIETTWKTWKTLFPETKVVSENTGYSRNYTVFPYGNYKNNNVVYFPVDNRDSRLSPKKRVLGIIISEEAKAYSFDSFYNVTETGSEGPSLIDPVVVLNDAFNNKNVVVIGSQTHNFAVAYIRTMADESVLEFTPVQDDLPVVMTDNEGNRWDMFGKAVSGPREGTQLKRIDQFIGYWFAWAAFYPDIELYE